MHSPSSPIFYTNRMLPQKKKKVKKKEKEKPLETRLMSKQKEKVGIHTGKTFSHHFLLKSDGS